MEEQCHLYPLRFRPVYKDYIWGGQRIIQAFRRDVPPDIYAESWEISSRDDGMSIAENGPWAGHTLTEIVTALGPRLLGAGVSPTNGQFPLLIKLIDSRERLSVQVHPDDAGAAKWGGEAKTEMWYVLDAAPDARVFAGLLPGVDRKAFEAAIRTGEVRSLLRTVPVRPGDAVYVPGGRVHAIDAGCLLLEVQQNSNTTYRIYDWGRVGHDGRPRQTHLAQALRVIRWKDEAPVKLDPRPLPAPPMNAYEEIVSCPFFRMERWTLRSPTSLKSDGDSFNIMFVAGGVVNAEWAQGTDTYRAGTTVLVPAGLLEVRLQPTKTGATLLRIRRPTNVTGA